MININDVYLCSKNIKNNLCICERFDDFDQAIKFSRENKYLLRKDFETTMITVCKFNPFKNFVLKYKLNKVFTF
jgi:hypothetical protein